MVEPIKRWVDYACHVSDVRKEEGGRGCVTYSVTMNKCDIDDEQMRKLLDILDKAAKDAAVVMGW